MDLAATRLVTFEPRKSNFAITYLFVFKASYFARGGLTVCVTCGWAGVDKTPRAGFCSGVEKSPKMPQNPTRQVHALLGSFFRKEVKGRKNHNLNAILL